MDRGTLRQLVLCVLVAGLIGGWALHGIDLAAVRAATAAADPAVLAVATVAFVAWFSVLDVLGFLLAYIGRRRRRVNVFAN